LSGEFGEGKSIGRGRMRDFFLFLISGV
jgi:hypothetical protein